MSKDAGEVCGVKWLRIAFATKNAHKVAEANRVLKSYGIELYPAPIEKLEIQSDSLEEIALVAARHAYRELGKPVVVEDSGLFIEELKGFPGPYSSYVYKTIGLKGVLKLLEGCSNRRAYFKAAVAIALREDFVKVFTGVVYGTISYEARGTYGFGFDPIFVPEGYSATFAELGEEVKCRISHRAKAFKALGAWLSSNKQLLSPNSLSDDSGGE